jgi:hypothetical protein
LIFYTGNYDANGVRVASTIDGNLDSPTGSSDNTYLYQGEQWEGTMTSGSASDMPLGWSKFAELTSEAPNSVQGKWLIFWPGFIPKPIPFASVGGSFGLSIKQVEVIAKPRNVSAYPNVWDLAGAYLGISFGAKIGSSNLLENPFKGLPTFIMGWGVGTELSTLTSYVFQAKVGIDQAISLPIYNNSLGGNNGNPEIPGGIE